MRFLPKTLDECINRIDCEGCRAGQDPTSCQLMQELAISERIANDDYLEYNPSTKRAYHYRAVNQIKRWCIPFICERCGSCVRVEVHHIDRDVTNNNINNLEVLCRCCHEKEHRGEDREY
jgi:hypothetical protein